MEGIGSQRQAQAESKCIEILNRVVKVILTKPSEACDRKKKLLKIMFLRRGPGRQEHWDVTFFSIIYFYILS
jgi:hypothetical protein